MKITNKLNILTDIIISHKFKGYDPYDIRAKILFIFFGLSPGIFKYIRYIVHHLSSVLTSNLLRKILFIKKEYNSKGIALLLSGNISYEIAGKYKTKISSKKLYDILLENKIYNTSSNSISWGYPFDWYSRKKIPRHTPSIVVTSFAGNSILDYYQYNKCETNPKILNCLNNFFKHDLNIFELKGTNCFSYTPIDTFRVHNANLLGVSFLDRLYTEYPDQCNRVNLQPFIDFSLNEISRDGLVYWYNEPNSVIDHYHTGFVLRSLNMIIANGVYTVPLEKFKYLSDYYINNLFHGCVPIITKESTKITDIHSCSEAIICLSTIDFNLSNQKNLLEKVITYTFEYHWDKKVGFTRFANKDRVIYDNTFYSRWSASWMYFALSSYFKSQYYDPNFIK